jgi:hypothetical protein
MGITSSEAGFQGLLAQLHAPKLTKPTETSTARRKLGRILDADRVAVIQTNLACQIGLKPTTFQRY